MCADDSEVRGGEGIRGGEGNHRLTQEMVQWRALLSTAMNLVVSSNAGNFLIGRVTVRYKRTPVQYAVR